MDQPIKISAPIESFLKVVEQETAGQAKADRGEPSKSEEDLGQIAYWYEKVRMAVDYREDHLLRRAASRRILKRLFLIEGRKKEVADHLLKELILGGYIKKIDLNEAKFIKINNALNKYAFAISLSHSTILTNPESNTETKRWLVSLASFEVEEILYPEKERRALINTMYNLLSPRIDTGTLPISAKQRNLQTYIAIYRSLAKADRAMLVSETFRVYFPDWFQNPNQKRIEQIMKNFDQVKKNINQQATSNYVSKIFYAIKKPMFFAGVLYQIVMANREDARGILSQDYLLRQFVFDKMKEEYQRVENKLNKRVQRGIIYIFLTKMLVALLVEIPYEKYFVGSLHYTSLLVNILVPPAFMFFLAKSGGIPGEANTEAVFEGVKRLVYDDPAKDEIPAIRVNKNRESAFSQKTLDIFYILIFSLVFGGLIWLLYLLEFNLVSGSIFVLFLATVSFFGALIRQSARDLSVIKSKESIFSLLFDTLLLPFVRFGRFVSNNFSRVNVLAFILDVIVEAPFKMVIRLVESWINFLKQKREEVDSQF